MLAEFTRHDVSILFTLLAVIAFGVAVWRASLRDVVGALVAAFVGVVILIVA